MSAGAKVLADINASLIGRSMCVIQNGTKQFDGIAPSGILEWMLITRRAFLYLVVVLTVLFAPAVEGALRLAWFWPLYVCGAAIVVYAFAFDSVMASPDFP
jgi:hypothetical protein